MTATTLLVERLQLLGAGMSEDNPYRADVLEAADRLHDAAMGYGPMARPGSRPKPAARPRLPTGAEVAAAAATACGVTAQDLSDGHRNASCALARGVRVYLLRRLLGWSFPSIAQGCGWRSHSAAIDAWERAKAAHERHEPAFAAAVARAEEELRRILT